MISDAARAKAGPLQGVRTSGDFIARVKLVSLLIEIGSRPLMKM